MGNPVDNAASESDLTQHNASLVVVAPGPRVRNILTDLTVISDAICVVDVSSGGVSIFHTALPANTPLIKDWHRGCKAPQNQDLTITVSAGNYDINASVVTA